MAEKLELPNIVLWALQMQLQAVNLICVGQGFPFIVADCKYVLDNTTLNPATPPPPPPVQTFLWCPYSTLCAVSCISICVVHIGKPKH